MKTLFAVLPFVRTEKPFPVAGITFRGSQDTEELKSEVADHLQRITSLFFSSEEKSIDEVVYAVLHLPDEHVQADVLVQRLRAAHTILTFLVTQDHLYDTCEQLTIARPPAATKL